MKSAFYLCCDSLITEWACVYRSYTNATKLKSQLRSGFYLFYFHWVETVSLETVKRNRPSRSSQASWYISTTTNWTDRKCNFSWRKNVYCIKWWQMGAYVSSIMLFHNPGLIQMPFNQNGAQLDHISNGLYKLVASLNQIVLWLNYPIAKRNYNALLWGIPI